VARCRATRAPARFDGVGKVWVLDTETKGTGANMVPLDKAQKQPDSAPVRSRRRPESRAAGDAPKRRGKPVVETTTTALPPGHVRKKATGEIGRIQSVDAKAGTAHVHWLKRGAASTVPLSAIARR
jgi:hypothetical protein